MYYHFRNLWLIKLINQLLSTLINTDPKKEKNMVIKKILMWTRHCIQFYSHIFILLVKTKQHNLEKDKIQPRIKTSLNFTFDVN